MNLIDAICSNTQVQSIVELSLYPIFRYQYPSLYDAIDQFDNTGDCDKPDAQRKTQDIQLMEMCL